MSIKVEVFDGEKWHCLSSNNHEATMNALNCNLRELQQKTNDLLTQLVISGSDNAPGNPPYMPYNFFTTNFQSVPLFMFNFLLSYYFADNNSNTEVCTEFDDDSDEN